MGAGASTSQTSHSGYPGEGRVGKFALSPDLQKETIVLSKLFDKLISKNNLLNFAELLTNRGQCGKLQVVLASQINKEFQTLRFPDPTQPTTLQIASFIDEEQYKQLQQSEILKVVCNRISEFLIRFVILIAALTFSITLPTGLPAISDSSAQDFYRPSQPKIAQYQIPSDIWNLFKPISKEIGEELLLINGEYFLNRGGYMYMNKPKSAIVDVRFQYYRYDTKSFSDTSPAVAEQIEKEEITRIQRETGKTEQEAKMELYYRKNPSARPGVSGYPGATGYGAPAGFPPSGAPAYPMRGGMRGGVRNKKQKRVTRKQNRRRGGGDELNERPPALNVGSPFPTMNSTGSVSPAPLPSPPSEIPFFKIQFAQSGKEYIFTEGFDVYERATFDITPDKKSLQPQIIQGRRMNMIWAIETIFSTLPKDSETEMIRERFSGAKSFDLLSFDNYKSESGREREYYSPAAYRAYLLASSIPIQNQKAVESYFCRDTWALTSFNSKPAFATLEGLYGYDPSIVIEGDEAALAKKSEYIDRMLGFKFAEQKIVDKTKKSAQSFEALQFPDNKDPKTRAKISGICASTRSTGIMVENKQSIDILMTGYNKLKQLYQQHVQEVYAFLKTILVVDSAFEQMIMLPADTPTTKPVIRLNETFVKYSTGSHMALNERIQTARNMLSEHYFQVEKIYNETLNEYNAAI